jgi:hypothetical protein
MRGNMQYLSFCVWLISLNMITSSSTHFPAREMISFFFMSEKYSSLYMCCVFFIHSLVVGHLGCFYSLATVNSAAINMGTQVPLLYPDLRSFRYMPRYIVRAYGKSNVSFLRNLHTDFHSGYTNLHCHQRWLRVPPPDPILTSTCFLSDSHCDWGEKGLSVILICYSVLTIEDVGQAL